MSHVVDRRDKRENSAYHAMRGKSRPAIIGTLRVTETVLSADGTETTRSLSGGGIIVRPKQDKESRRWFRRFCARMNIITHPVERSASPTDTRTEDDVTAYQCIGDGPALQALTTCGAVQEWHYAVSAPTPRGSSGSGTLTPAAEQRLKQAKRENVARFTDAERETAVGEARFKAEGFITATRSLFPPMDADGEAFMLELLTDWFRTHATAPQSPEQLAEFAATR